MTEEKKMFSKGRKIEQMLTSMDLLRSQLGGEIRNEISKIVSRKRKNFMEVYNLYIKVRKELGLPIYTARKD